MIISSMQPTLNYLAFEQGRYTLGNKQNMITYAPCGRFLLRL